MAKKTKTKTTPIKIESFRSRTFPVLVSTPIKIGSFRLVLGFGNKTEDIIIGPCFCTVMELRGGVPIKIMLHGGVHPKMTVESSMSPRIVTDSYYA